MMACIVEVHRYLSTAIDGTSALLNMLLLYLILKCSPPYMKTYKFLILLSCIGDLALSLVSIFGQPVVAHDHEYAMVISNGFFSRRSSLLDHIAMALYCVSLHANIVFIVVQFIWRFSVLSKDMLYERL
ncbi:hypothetical protein AAVH_27157 [Aphelenchoides avenae]|nr:hypothetical protein AAVH_27157 [Aphelenchus avenae]